MSLYLYSKCIIGHPDWVVIVCGKQSYHYWNYAVGSKEENGKTACQTLSRKDRSVSIFIVMSYICDAANVAILQQHYTMDSFHSNNFTKYFILWRFLFVVQLVCKVSEITENIQLSRCCRDWLDPSINANPLKAT